MITMPKYLVKRKMMYAILFFFCISTTALAGEVTYQAEDYTFSNDCLLAIDYPGYNGAGFVDMGGYGSHFRLENIHAKDGEGKYVLRFRYASDGDGYRPCQIKVNDNSVGYLSFQGTDSWSAWGWTTIRADLTEGDNTLDLTAITYFGGPNVDEIQLERIYRIDVQNGLGAAWGFSGESFPIKADQAPDGQVFYKWKVASGKAKIKDKNSPETTIEIKKDDAVVKATYIDIPEMCYSACDTKTEKCDDIGVDECIRECAIDEGWSNAYVACTDRAETCRDVKACDKFVGCLNGGPVDNTMTPFSTDPENPTMLLPDTSVLWTIYSNCLPTEQDVYYRATGTKKWKKGKDFKIEGPMDFWFKSSLSRVNELAETLGPGAWDLKLVIAGDDYEPFYVKVPGEENVYSCGYDFSIFFQDEFSICTQFPNGTSREEAEELCANIVVGTTEVRRDKILHEKTCEEVMEEQGVSVGGACSFSDTGNVSLFENTQEDPARDCDASTYFTSAWLCQVTSGTWECTGE